MVTLYSTGCPACKVLKKKLDAAGILYNENTCVDEMNKLGITRVPVLIVDDTMLGLAEASQWITKQTKEAIDEHSN